MRTCQEWSLGFDLLYDNIASGKAPGLNAYEKSVLLTGAQESTVIALYSGAGGDGFEATEAITQYLGSLVRQEDCQQAGATGVAAATGMSSVWLNPADLLFRTLESCDIDSGCGTEAVQVVPVTQDELWRTVRNPFKGPGARRVLRLSYAVLSGGGEESRYTELVSRYPVSRYSVRYLARPEPIILEDLPDGLTVNGESAARTCGLPEETHRMILEAAVSAAKALWAS